MKFPHDEIKARINLGSVVAHDLGDPVKQHGAWRMYFCPFHKNTHTPALGVNIQTGTFKCFGCGKQGDIFTWRMLFANENFRDALTYFRETTKFGWAAEGISLPQKQSSQVDPPGPAWQTRGREFIHYAQQSLIAEPGKPGRAELSRRKIAADSTLKWNIGFNPEWIKEDPERWGLPRTEDRTILWLPRGLVIPCFIDEVLWYIKVRVFDKDGLPAKKIEGNSKYAQIAGGKSAPFGINYFQGNTGMLLAESELDAVLAWQQGGDLLDVATLGGAGKNLSTQWLPHFLPYFRIFIAYDLDAAGAHGAETLQKRSGRLIASLPPFGDLTDYHVETENLRGFMEELASEIRIQQT